MERALPFSLNLAWHAEIAVQFNHSVRVVMEKVLVIGLDGYETSIADRMLESGQLPAIKKLRDQSARFSLDHGTAKRTGLAWEHVNSGLSPEKARRWSAVYFDPDTYEVDQKGAIFSPFPTKMNVRTVVFDVPYFNLKKAPDVRGITSWGAHDAGTENVSQPATLQSELIEKFGTYQGTDWIYGFAWPSPLRCEMMGNALARAVDQRTEITRWLFRDRLPDWDLGMVVVSELHSVIEGLWHGVDASHPLYNHSSATVAGEGIRKVYKAVDDLVSNLQETFKDCSLILFSMHGMGPNQSDVPGMVLLPELLHRYAFGKTFFHQPQKWSDAENGVPILSEADSWQIKTPKIKDHRSSLGRLWTNKTQSAKPRKGWKLHWMPAARYQYLWHKMPAFALPSYYDGSIRINLAGRERSGFVPLSVYPSFCSEIMDLVKLCHDPITGDCVVDHFLNYGEENPLTVHPTQGDLIVVWKGSPLAFDHPAFGRIGPVPFRRPGGHTGSEGLAYIRSSTIPAGDYGTHSAFDIVPTIFDLLDQPVPAEMDGHPLTRKTGKESLLIV